MDLERTTQPDKKINATANVQASLLVSSNPYYQYFLPKKIGLNFFCRRNNINFRIDDAQGRQF